MCLAIPGKIVEIVPGLSNRAMVDVLGVRRGVDVSLVEPEGIGVGDWVLIHVGFAMSKIREEDALDQIRMLTELGETEAAVMEAQGYSVDEPEPPPGERSHEVH